MTRYGRWVTMAVLCMSGGVIFMLPFLFTVYYVPMQNAFGFSNSQMGNLMSIFGAMSLLAYFPGGWLADRFTPRRLISVSLLSTGLVGFYYATLPSYKICLFIHAYWGASISLVFWSALIKATRNWAPHTEQGRAFGLLEGGRGITEASSSSIFLALFVWLGKDDLALSQVIILFSISNIALAFLVWFSLDKESKNDPEPIAAVKQKVGLRDVIEVLKIPEIWLIAVVIMAAYSSYWGTYYFTAYATKAFAMSVAMGGTIGVAATWLNPLAALTTGFLSDRVGISRAVCGLLILLVLTFFTFGMLPQKPSMIILLLLTIAMTSFAVYALRGIYFALLEEGGIPAHVTGTAAGIVSVIGFLPDIYMPYVGGRLLDRFPEAEGYRYYYFMISGICVIGSLAAFTIMRRTQKRQAGKFPVPSERMVENE